MLADGDERRWLLRAWCREPGESGQGPLAIGGCGVCLHRMTISANVMELALGIHARVVGSREGGGEKGGVKERRKVDARL